jgi:hypothetical protein
MNHRFACLLLATLSVAANEHPSMLAASIGPGADVDILVDGVPQPQFAHDGRWYIEALKGREYAIRLHNPYGVRVAVALSVDGLNTIDARQTTATGASKWVLGPYETVTISGWQTSRTEARRFEFTTEAHSYGQALGRTANLGLISAVFFRERTPPVSREPSEYAGGRAQAEQSAPPRQEASTADARARKSDDEYAATGMGRRTGHEVMQVWLDLEPTPVQTVDIRYEFRPQLARLGILPLATTSDPLRRRERARGFEPRFSPVPHDR